MSFDLPALPNEWTYLPLDSCCLTNSVTYGVVQPGAALSEGKPIIRVNNFRDTRIDFSDVMYISPEIEAKYNRTRLKGGEVLLTIVGSVGQVAVVPKCIAGFNVARAVAVIHPLQHIAPEWIALCLRSPLSQHLLGSRANTTVQTTINLKDLRALPIPLPPEPERQTIVEFVGALDDRITLLRETNATLEAIAQALFKSWFVDFDPVHANQQNVGRISVSVTRQDIHNAEAVDVGLRLSPDPTYEISPEIAALFPDSFEESELGLVPRGWRCVPLVDAYEINPQRKLKKGEMASYLDMASLPTSGHCSEQVIQREMGSGSKFTNGDTLLARITPCLENGKSGFVDFLADNEIGWGSTEFLVLRPKLPLPEYHAYLLCRHKAFRDFAIQSMSGTSGRQRIQNDVLGRYLLVLPPTSVAESFGNIVTPIQQRIAANHSQAQTIATLRDTLLPRLISGQLRLPKAEAMIETV